MLGSNLNIMSDQWTDLIFKNRNQAYGAYQLRKENANTTNRALLIAISIFAFAIAAPTLISKIHGVVPKVEIPVERKIIVNIQPPVIIPDVKPKAEPQKQVRPPHDMIRSLPPVVTDNAHEDPPTVKQLETADPGPETMKGIKGAAPVIDDKVGKVEQAGRPEPSLTDIFITSEIQPAYPGGFGAFSKFLSDHIRYPAVAKENSIQGRVFLQFVVERDGSLTDMKIIKDPGSGLGDEAQRVLKMSPRWKPGMQNGKAVRVQYTIPVNFSLAE